LKIGTLIDLYKENIPWISDIAKSLVKKDKRFAHHVEEVEEGFKSDAQRQDAVASLYRTLGLKGASKRSRDKAKDKDKKKEEVEEGTWHIAKDMTKLKNTMKRPMPLGTGSFDFVAKYIGDDELWDDLGALKTNQDMVPAIKKAMKRLGIKEEVELTEGNPLAKKWIDTKKKGGFKVGNIELVAGKEGVHTIKKNGKKIGDFSLDDWHWVVNIDGARGQGTYNEIDDIVKDLQKNKMYFEELTEADLSKSQVKMVHKQADKLSVTDFIKRYGADGDSVRYATATNIVKKKLGIGEEVIEEVELTEAIDAASYAKQIAGATARNDHFGARVIIARMMKDKQLENFYNTLEKMHTTSQVSNAIGNDAITLRGKLEKVLISRLKSRASVLRLNAADVKTLMDAL
jgi:hypothetical protein